MCPCDPDSGRIWPFDTHCHVWLQGPRRGRAGVNPRPRRVGGAALGPGRLPHPAVAGVHAVCARAARIRGGFGLGTHLGVCAERADCVKLRKKKQVSSGSFVILSQVERLLVPFVVSK